MFPSSVCKFTQACHTGKAVARCITTQTYDVVVSGGGMVGTATAAALGKNDLFHGKRILLLESSPHQKYKPSVKYSNRVSAISPSSKQLLEDIGAWNKIEAARYQPVSSMYVWEACSQAAIKFGSERLAGDVVTEGNNLAYLVENDLTVAALSECIKECLSVDVAYNTTATRYTLPKSDGQLTQPAAGSLVDVELSNGDTISTRMLIGADGFNSMVRRSAGINTASWKYEQVGVVCTLKLAVAESDLNQTAWQRFLPTGPIAILPLSKTESSLVWSTVPSHGKHLLSLSADEFVAELNKALNEDSHHNSLVEPLLSGYTNLLQTVLPSAGQTKPYEQRHPPHITGIDTESRTMFPFGYMHADKYVAPRLALVGDACHRIHPLAGQGVNLGFGDVECLVRNLTKAVKLGIDIGWVDHLLDYETERQRHVAAISLGCDGLYRLYSNSWSPLVLMRSLGLATVNSLQPIKDFFMRHAQT